MRAARDGLDGEFAGDARVLNRVSTPVEFAEQLKALKDRSGRSLRDLSAAISRNDGARVDREYVHASHNTLGDWCSGRHLPGPGQHEAFTRLLDEFGIADHQPWLDALIRVRERSARGPDAAAPYKGLESFRCEDADRFFGRDDLVGRVLERLAAMIGDGALRMLWIIGASGSGKSSLLQAGVVGTLTNQAIPCVSITPGDAPCDRLAQALRDSQSRATEGAPASHGTGAPSSKHPAGGSGHASAPDQVVVVDQFEELFTECDDEDERERFLDAVAQLADPRSDRRCAVVLGLRTDFYADVATRERFTESLESAQILVGPMGPDELRSAIMQPAKNAACTVDDELLALLIRDVVPAGSLSGQYGVGMLPLLSHALLETWRLRRRGRMTVADYIAAGGIAGAVEASAEAAFAELTPSEQSIAERAFLRLVNIDGEKVATRRSATYAELDGLVAVVSSVGDDASEVPGPDAADASEGAASPPRAVTRLLEPFVDARLLTAHETAVEVTHEALLTAWPRLRGWIDAHRDALVEHRRIADATQVWLDHDRDPSTLAGGDRLGAMRSWAESTSHRSLLNNDERDFLDASVRRAVEDEASRRRGVRRLRTLAAIASVFALIASGLLVYANRARSDAVAARDEALSRQIAVVAEGLSDRDMSVASQLAVAAYRMAPTSEARAALLDLGAEPIPATFHGAPGSTAVAVSRSGERMALSNSAEATVQLFTRSTDGYHRAGLIELDDSELEIYTLEFVPDETFLATGASDGAVTLWDVSDARQPRQIGGPLHGPGGAIQRIAISPDGAEIAAAGATELFDRSDDVADGITAEAVFRWNIEDPSSPTPLPALRASTEITWGVAYSPDGRLVAHANHEDSVELWDVSGGDGPQRIGELQVGGPGSIEAVRRRVTTVAFSPDGAHLSAGSSLADLHVWDVTDVRAPAEVDVADARFGSWVNTTAFSPDGRFFVAGSSDQAMRVWNTTTWQSVAELSHPAAVTHAAFDGEGTTLVTAAADGSARVWDMDASVRVTMEGRVFSFGFTESGDRLLVGSGEDVGVWDIDGDLDWRPLPDPVTGVPGDPTTGGPGGAISPDGSLMTRGTIDGGELRFYDLSGGAEPVQIDLPQGTTRGIVQAAAFRPDQQVLAAGGDDSKVRLWDIRDPHEPRLAAELAEPHGSVLQTTWNPDGRTLAVASLDSNVYLYDVADVDDPNLLATLGGHGGEVYAARFTPDGAVMVTAGTDSKLNFWDVTDPTAPSRIGQSLEGPTGRIYDVALHPSGHTLAAGVTDGTIWLWDISNRSRPRSLATIGPVGDPIYSLAFSPDGHVLVAGGADRKVRIWHLDEDAVIDHICANLGDHITEEEWSVYLPNRAYDPPCE